MRKLLIKPSPAAAVGSLAIFVSLTGTGITAVSQVLPRGSVGTAQLRANAVTTPKIRNGSLLAAEFRAGQVPAGPAGPQGQAGPEGPKGDKGEKGDQGPVPSIFATTAGVNVPDGGVSENGHYASAALQTACPDDARAIAGGIGWSSEFADDELWTGYLRPLQNAEGEVTGFRVRGGNDSGPTSRLMLVYVMCYRT